MLLLQNFLASRRLIGERLGVKLAREILDRRNDARSWAIHGITNHREAMITNGIENLPCGETSKRFELRRDRLRVRYGENEKIRLQPGHLFETDLRPVQRGIDNGDRPSAAHGVGDKGVLADGDERLGPNGKKDAFRRQSADPFVQTCETTLHIRSNSFSRFRRTQNVGEFLGGGNNFGDRVGVRGIRRNTQIVEGMNGLKPVQALGHENEVRMQSGDLLEAGIDRAADFGFFLGIGRVITIVGVTDEAILEAERVDGFRQTRGEGNDAANGLRNTDGSAGFIDNLAVERGGGGGRRQNGLCTQMRRCGQQDSDREAGCGSEARTCNFFQEIPRQRNFRGATKKPHETPRGLRQRSFSRRARASAAREGGLAYGFSADYSGGTAADSHGLPRYPCLQIEIRVYAAPTSMSTTSANLANPLPPDRAANSPRALHSAGCGHEKVHNAGV